MSSSQGESGVGGRFIFLFALEAGVRAKVVVLKRVATYESMEDYQFKLNIRKGNTSVLTYFNITALVGRLWARQSIILAIV